MTDNSFLEESTYTSVRAAVMRSLLIKKKEYVKLAKMTLAEISNFLAQTSYADQIAHLALEESGIDLIEKALNENYKDSIAKIKRISPPSYQVIIQAYLLRNDAENIKTILRGIITKLPKEEVQELLIPSWKITNLHTLLAFDSVDDLLASLPKPFEGISSKSLFEMETAIDKAFYKASLSLAKNLADEAHLFKQFLLILIEAADILTVLKLQGEDFDMASYIIHPTALVRKIMGAGTKEAVGEILKNSKYQIDVEESLVKTELGLKKYVFHETLRFQHQNPFSVYVVLSYLFAKETEIHNIRTIIQAKHLGITNVEEHLI